MCEECSEKPNPRMRVAGHRVDGIISPDAIRIRQKTQELIYSIRDNYAKSMEGVIKNAMATLAMYSK